MKFSKRIAIGVMVTAIALSLTACGGAPATSQPANDGETTGSNTSTGETTGDKKDDSTTPPKEDTKDDTKKDDVQAQSRTEKFFSGRYAINGKRWTYKVDSLYMNGEKQWTGTTIIASDGYRAYERMENFTGVADESDIYDPAKGVYYRVYSDTNRVVQYSIEGSRAGLLIYDYLYNTPKRTPSSNYKAGTYEINNVMYYCETWSSSYNGSESTTIFCFDKDDVEGKNLRYCISQSKTGDTVTNYILRKVSNISTEFDARLLQVPEGYDFYIYDKATGKEASTGTKTAKDYYPN